MKTGSIFFVEDTIFSEISSRLFSKGIPLIFSRLENSGIRFF